MTLAEFRVENLKAPQPLTFGIPLARGKLLPKDLKNLNVTQEGKIFPTQARALCYWPDGSVKWVLLDFVPETEGDYQLFLTPRKTAPQRDVPPYPQIFHLHLLDENGKRRTPKFSPTSKPETGPVRTCYLRVGEIRFSRRKRLEIFEYLHFYPTLSLFRLDLSVRNPHRAHHPGGYWDLGDKGSLYLKELALSFLIPHKGRLFLKVTPEDPLREVKEFGLYQESSGGQNWLSQNHVNRLGEVPLRFCGFRLQTERETFYGKRAQPAVYFRGADFCFSLAVPYFWQNFPKSLRFKGKNLEVSLFPKEFPDLHEIQGGEQKTHTVWFSLDGQDLSWVFSPAMVKFDPQYLTQTKTIFYFTSESESHPLHQKIIDEALGGPNSFLVKREIIDEYGWRNFGDVYADHENAFNQSKEPIVSHYNNQYDLLYSFLLQYLKRGESLWFKLAAELARHVYDIDIYHTQEDKPAYNQGLFWHTFHYVPAYRSTHRCYSKDAGVTGGGPSNEHLYSSGLLLYHLLTGDPLAREAVINFAEHVIEMDKPYPFLRLFDKTPSGLASQTRDPWYHGPGRGAGNAINCLLDAFCLTRKRRYLAKAEELIRRSIHPKDDIEARGLRNPEERWSYTVFLQILGKYLLLKLEWQELDFMFAYARASLLHYASWMAENEYVYLDRPDLLEYPTETWAAQEMRKAEVFNLAAYFSDSSEMRKRFRERACYFYEESLRRLFSFPTWSYTRPVAIVLQSGFSYPWFEKEKPFSGQLEEYDFGKPQKFVPQKLKLLQMVPFLKKIRS